MIARLFCVNDVTSVTVRARANLVFLRNVRALRIRAESNQQNVNNRGNVCEIEHNKSLGQLQYENPVDLTFKNFHSCHIEE